jgi:Pentapeptide repeats (8 copies)
VTNVGEPGASHQKVVPTWLSNRWSEHPLVVLAAVVVLALAVSVALIWPITDLIAAHDVGLITASKHAAALQTARSAVRTQLLTLGAGVFAAGALIYTARNFALTRHTVELTEQGQVTDRYAKAIEQLGSNNLDVHIGGIYALERISRDSARDHPTVMEVLAAFIRDHSQPDHDGGEQDRLTFPDVQAALTVIGRRDSKRDIRRIDLTGAYLRSASLRGADLTHVNLTSAYLARADLDDADLTNADLTDASLTDAKLTRTNLSRAFLAGVIFAGANLTDANLTDTNLTGVDLTSAQLTGATYTDADLTGVKWPEGVSVPEGWTLDIRSGELEAAGTESKSADAN